MDEKWFIEIYNGASEASSNVGLFDSDDAAEIWINKFLEKNSGPGQRSWQFTIHCINSPELAMDSYGSVITDPAYDF